jgi:pseudoazurin
MTTSLKADEQPASIPGSSSKEHIIVAQGTRFEPTVVFVSSGDIITWTNMEGHDTESIDNMIPAGAVKWRSILGQKISVNLKREGAYIYKCNPHLASGMLGAIIVGELPPTNLKDIDQALDSIPVSAHMVASTIRKMKKAIAIRWGT